MNTCKFIDSFKPFLKDGSVSFVFCLDVFFMLKRVQEMEFAKILVIY